MNYNSLENIKENSTFYQFMEIEQDSHHEKVRFFENNRSSIKSMDFDFRIYVWCDYALSVFEIGRYQEFIKLSDQLIPLVVEENVYEVRGISIYEALLFRKGASLFNIHQYRESEYVFSELCKIEKEPINKKAWRKAKYRILKSSVRFMEAISVLFFIATAVIIAIELLIVVTLYPDYSAIMEKIRLVTFGFGLLTIFSTELYVKLKSNKDYKQLISKKQ